jgi:hypothetical protein
MAIPNERKAERSQVENPPAQALHVDLQARQKQQKGQSDEGQDRDGQVGLDPSEHRRAQDDAEHDLEHDCRQPQPGKEPKSQRRQQASRHDDQQVGEVHFEHGR